MGWRIKDYEDGCDVHPHCLTCPLPQCRFDGPHVLQSWETEQRRRKAIGLIRAGHDVASVAKQLGVTERGVYRYLAAARKEIKC